MFAIGGALKEAGYRSIAGYLMRYKKEHIEKGGQWSEKLAAEFSGAIRAAARGLGPATRAGPFTQESWLRVATLGSAPAHEHGPVWPGRFITVGTWWLMREIEVALLTIEQVEADEMQSDRIAINLSACKTDPQGKGFRRVHTCICARDERLRLPCPVCAIKSQLTARELEGATRTELLFPTAEGNAASKAGSFATLQKSLVQASEAKIDGHSMRRVGAQMLTHAGVEPWLVEWFGRWGSSAIKAYVEDASADAPEASSLAARVCGQADRAASSAARASDSEVSVVAAIEDCEATATGIAQTDKSVISTGATSKDDEGLVELIIKLIREQQEEAAKEAVLVRYVLGKVHITCKAVHDGPWKGGVAVCDCHYGMVREEAVAAVPGTPAKGQWCKKCRDRAVRLALVRGGEALVAPEEERGQESSWGGGEALVAPEDERGQSSSPCPGSSCESSDSSV